MNLLEAMEKHAQITAENPLLVLTGSLSLIIAGAIPPRDIHDLDYVALSSFDVSNLRKIAYSETNNGCDTYEGRLADGTQYNVFFHQGSLPPLIVINKITMVAPYVSLAWKAKYGRVKDQLDLYKI